MPDFNKQEILAKPLARSIPMLKRELNIDEENRTVELSFSSDAPIYHWFGYLILDHSEGSARLDRINTAGSLLWMHDRSCQLASTTNVRLDKDGKGRCTAKFSRVGLGAEKFQDVQDEICRTTSFGFSLYALDPEVGNDGKQMMIDGEPVYRSRDWEPFEISLEPIPADTGVGVGRSLEVDHKILDLLDKNATHTVRVSNTEKIMENEETQEPVVETPKTELSRAGVNTKTKELIELGEMFGEVELARDFAAEDKSAAELKRAILEKRQSEQAKIPAKPVVELNEKETAKYSIARAILADADMRDGKNAGSFEREVSDELLRQINVKGFEFRGGILIPTNIQLKRAGLDTASSTKGQTTVFTEFGGSLIELLRNKAKVLMLGATVLAGLQGNVSFPRQTGGATASWVGENPGADVAESNLMLDNITLSPKTLQATTSYSRQLLAQAAVGIDAIVTDDLALINALAIDKAALHGTGSSNQPTGIYAASGVNAVAFGGSVAFAKLVDMETAIATSNADAETMAYLTTPGVKGKAKQTAELANTINNAIWREGEMNGYRAEASNQVSAVLGAGTNEHGLIFADWSQLLFGEWGALEVITDPYRLKKQGMIEVTTFNMVDIQRRHAESFCKATGLIP